MQNHPSPTSKIDVNKVSKVYSGRPGCACGCRGNYFSSSKFPSEGKVVNDKMVARVVKLFNDNLDKVEDYGDGIFVYNPSENRTYTVYTEGWK